MRNIQRQQMSLGQVGIASIEFDPKCRDDITQILLGLQYIYVTPDVRERVFEILQHIVPNRTGKGLTGEQLAQKADPDLGRSGMDQWKILVLGVLRLGLNTDYDRIHNLANNHNTVRQMLEHDDWYDTTKYSLQTIKDNVGLFTQEILDQVSHEAIKAGHTLVKKTKALGKQKKRQNSSVVVIPLWLRPISNFQPTSPYFTMPYVRGLQKVLHWLNSASLKDGDNISTTSSSSKNNSEKSNK